LVADVSGQLISSILKCKPGQEECWATDICIIYYTGDGVGSSWFSGNIKETISLLDHEVAARTWGRKNVKRGAGWVTPEW